MKPLLTVPTRGMIGWATVTRLEEIHREMGLEDPILYQRGNLSCARTRNQVVAAFMGTDCDVLVMVDDDIVPSPGWLAEILPFMDEWGMICLPHPMPLVTNPSVLVFSLFERTQDGYQTVPPVDGLNECDLIATGCVAINRKALEQLGPNPFRLGDDIGEDFQFCLDLHTLGFKVGYWWDGFYADHHTITSLAPLIEARMTV